MGKFSALLTTCARNSPVTGEFPSQRPVTRSFDVFLICVWINGWVNNDEAGDLTHRRYHYDVKVMDLSGICPNSAGSPHWYWENRMIVPLKNVATESVKLPWRILLKHNKMQMTVDHEPAFRRSIVCACSNWLAYITMVVDTLLPNMHHSININHAFLCRSRVTSQ